MMFTQTREVFTDFVPKTRNKVYAPEQTLSDAIASICGNGQVDVVENDEVSYTYIIKNGVVVSRNIPHPIFKDKWQTMYFA